MDRQKRRDEGEGDYAALDRAFDRLHQATAEMQLKPPQQTEPPKRPRRRRRRDDEAEDSSTNRAGLRCGCLIGGALILVVAVAGMSLRGCGHHDGAKKAMQADHGRPVVVDARGAPGTDQYVGPPDAIQLGVVVRSKWEFNAVADLVGFLKGHIPQTEIDAAGPRGDNVGEINLRSLTLHTAFPEYTQDQMLTNYCVTSGVDREVLMRAIGEAGEDGMPTLSVPAALALNWVESRFQREVYNVNRDEHKNITSYDMGPMEVNIVLDNRILVKDPQTYYAGGHQLVSQSLIILRDNAPYGCRDKILAAGMSLPAGHGMNTLQERMGDLHKTLSSPASSQQDRDAAAREWSLISAGRDASELLQAGRNQHAMRLLAQEIFNPYNVNQNIATSFRWVRSEAATIRHRMGEKYPGKVLTEEDLTRYMGAVYNTGGPRMWEAIREAKDSSTTTVISGCKKKNPLILERDRSLQLLGEIFHEALDE